ncbi:TPA: hypothetical protein ACGCO1_001377 [Legionella pneumophila]
MNELVIEASKWVGIRMVISVERRRDIKDKIEEETQYYISTLPINLSVISD